MATNPYYHSRHWRELREACLKRDRYRCTVEGCTRAGRVADHIVSRPHVMHPCTADTLGNLRTLCWTHDAQVKERHRGAGDRKQGGEFRLKGCDVAGWPLDPKFRR